MSNSQPTQENTPSQSSPQTTPSALLPPSSSSTSESLKSPPAYPSTTASFSSNTPRRITPSSSSASSITSTPTSLHRSDTDYSDLDLAFSPTDTAFSPVLTGEEDFEHRYHWQYYIPHISTSTADYYTDCSWIAFDLVEPPAASNPSATPTRTTQYAAAGVSGEYPQMDTAPLRSPIPRTPEEVELPYIGEEGFEYYTSPTERAGMRYPFIGYVRTRQTETSPVGEEDRAGGRKEGMGSDKGRTGGVDRNRELFGQLRKGEQREGACVERKGRGLAGLLGSLRLGRRSGRSRRYTS